MHAKQLMTALAIAALSSTALVAAHAASPQQPSSAENRTAAATETQEAHRLFANWGAGYFLAPTASAFASPSDSTGASGARNAQSGGAIVQAKAESVRSATDAVYGIAGPAILVP